MMTVFSQRVLPQMSGSCDREEQDGSAEAGVVLATSADVCPRVRKESVHLDGALSFIVG